MKLKYQILFSLFVISGQLFGQSWSQLDLKGMLEYEGQRYLMEEVYDISTEEFEWLRIEKLVVETDNFSGGFLFAITAYKYKGNKGVVLTSFTPQSSNTSIFFNIHLTQEEFNSILDDFESGSKLKGYEIDHFVKRINEQIVIEIGMGIESEPIYIFWINGIGRHKFGKIGFARMKKKYHDFMAN